ncbi:MAG TPA: iron ABC transporter permease [Cytophagales bacterium]|nr:iron ABC transporter permease [Cytophagales bacterium]
MESRAKEEILNRKKKRKPLILLVVLFFALLFFFIGDIALGSIHIPLNKIISILFADPTDNLAWNNIILKIRLPKATTAVLVGAALSVSGLQMQTLFRNPLAGPSVLGITSGASLGVALVMLSSGFVTTVFAIRSLGFLSSWLLIFSATMGAFLTLLFVLAIASKVRDNVILLLVGLMVSHITIALVSIWQYFSQPDQIKDYLMWTFGSLGGVTREHLFILSIVVVLGLMMAFGTSKALNVLLLGENYARSLGLSVNYSRIIIIISTSLMAGSITAFCGPIGFIGIAVPHLSRSLLNTSDHKILIPVVCLLGGVIMLFCDIVTHLPGKQSILPINAITSLIGAPVVISVILRKNNLKSSFS